MLDAHLDGDTLEQALHSAAWAWGALGIVVLALEAACVRSGHEMLTHCWRRHRRVAAPVTAVVVAHLVDVLGPLDPIHHLGRALVRVLTPGAAR